MSTSALLQVPSPQSTVLLICDVQERFRSAIHGFDAMVGTCSKMVKAAKLLQIPVIATEQNPKALGVTVDEVGISGLPDELNLGAYPKTKFSMWTEPVIDKLKSRNLESAIVVGIESHVCVLQTTLDLLREGITPYVLADGVSSCNRQEIPLALERLRQAGAVISTSESLLFQLVGDASSPLFKPFAGMVKDEKPTTAKALQTLADRAESQL